MKRLCLPLALFALTVAHVPAQASRCIGAANCRACHNCSRCAHCNEGGGTCGVCAAERRGLTHLAPHHKTTRHRVSRKRKG